MYSASISKANRASRYNFFVVKKRLITESSTTQWCPHNWNKTETIQ